MNEKTKATYREQSNGVLRRLLIYVRRNIETYTPLCLPTRQRINKLHQDHLRENIEKAKYIEDLLRERGNAMEVLP